MNGSKTKAATQHDDGERKLGFRPFFPAVEEPIVRNQQ